jgi:hypothetical protein
MTPDDGAAGTSISQPSLDDFIRWPAGKIRPFVQGKTVVLSTSGTSRWYFLEYGDIGQGYDAPERFLEYGRRVIQRVIEMTDILYSDGIESLFLVGFGGSQGRRNTGYVENLKWVYNLLIDETSRALYDQHEIGVLFRGDWGSIFTQLGADDLTRKFEKIEQETAARRRWLIWYVPDDLIPSSLVPLVAEHIERTGEMPDRTTLARAYYGRPFQDIDILIGNNKPSITNICPPLLSLKDLYFTVSPITYLERRQWRKILYDHLFARRGQYRDFTALTAETLEEMRAFYKVAQDDIIGVGTYHRPTQCWRPAPWYSADGSPDDG